MSLPVKFWGDEPPQDRLYLSDDFPAEPGDARLEQQERDWERDEAEQREDEYANDPGRVDA